MRADELYKFSDGTLKKIQDELHHRVLDFDLGYNKEMERRKWTATDKKRSVLMVELIDKQMREKKIIRNLEDGTLKKIRDELHHRVLDFDLGYNKEMER
nr:hypothetical protein [Tanacetum cinerariifolium]